MARGAARGGGRRGRRGGPEHSGWDEGRGERDVAKEGGEGPEVKGRLVLRIISHVNVMLSAILAAH